MKARILISFLSSKYLSFGALNKKSVGSTYGTYVRTAHPHRLCVGSCTPRGSSMCKNRDMMSWYPYKVIPTHNRRPYFLKVLLLPTSIIYWGPTFNIGVLGGFPGANNSIRWFPSSQPSNSPKFINC